MSVGDSDSGLSICSGAAPRFIKIEIRVPDLDLKKIICVPNTESVAYIKRALTDSLSTRLRDAPNYGLFIPGTSGKAGKFLQEERPIKDYGLSSDNSMVELRYKKRLFKSITVNISKLKKLHSKTNLKSFLEMVMANDTSKVLKMLNKGLDPNYQMRDSGETPLTKACCLKNPVEMIKTLVEGGAHLDYRHANGYTPIHVAAIKGNSEALKTLLDLGQSPNTVDLDNLTPLYHSVMNDASAVATERLLFDFSIIGVEDEHGLHEIHQACRFGRVQHLEYLLQYGADINCQTSRNANTPLHICAYLDQESCARFLLFRGADRSLVNRSGQTPYQQAVFSSNLAIAQLIQEYRNEDVVPMRVNPQYNQNRKSSIINIQSFRRSKSASRLSESSVMSGQQQYNHQLSGEYAAAREDSGCHSNFSGSGRSRENSCRLPSTSTAVSLGKTSGKQLSQSVRRASNYGHSMTLSRSITNLNNGNSCIDSEEGFLGGAWWPDWDRDNDVLSSTHDGSLADESIISGATNSTASSAVGPMQRRSARSKTKASNGKVRSQSAKRRSSFKGDISPDVKNVDASFLPRMVVLQKTSQGFGFVIRGLKASSSVEFVPTKKHPALQYFEDIEPNSVASKAGIKKGDFILQINSHNVESCSHEDTVSLIKASGDILALKIVTVATVSKGNASKKSSENKAKYNDWTIRSYSTRERRQSGPNPYYNPAQDSSLDTDGCSSISSPTRPVSSHMAGGKYQTNTIAGTSSISKQRPPLTTMINQQDNSIQIKTLPIPHIDPLPPPESAMLANSPVKIRKSTSSQPRPPSIVSVDSIYPLPPPPTSDTPISPKFSTISEEEPIKSHLSPPPATQVPPPPPSNNVPPPPPPTNQTPPPPPPPANKVPPPPPNGPPGPPPNPPSSGPPKSPPLGPPKPPNNCTTKPLLAGIEKPPILKHVVIKPQPPKAVNNIPHEFDSHLRMAIAKRRQKMDCDQMSMTSVESCATNISIQRRSNNNGILPPPTLEKTNQKSCTSNSNKLYLI